MREQGAEPRKNRLIYLRILNWTDFRLRMATMRICLFYWREEEEREVEVTTPAWTLEWMMMMTTTSSFYPRIKQVLAHLMILNVA